MLSTISGKDSIRILTYNVWYGFTKKPERKKSWFDYIQSLKVDVLVLQELNGYTEKRLREDAKHWGHSSVALLKNDGFPTGITSKYPISEIERQTARYHHGMLSCKTAGIKFFVMHLHPGHWEIRHQEVDVLLKSLSKISQNEPVLLAGDFNTFSQKDKIYYDQMPDLIPFFRRLDLRWKSNRNLRDDRIDYTHLTKFEQHGFVDLIALRREKFLGTFPTKLRIDEDNGPSRRLDYFFANDVLAQRCMNAKYLVNEKTDFLSDHYPAIAEFKFR